MIVFVEQILSSIRLLISADYRVFGSSNMVELITVASQKTTAVRSVWMSSIQFLTTASWGVSKTRM